MNHTIKFILLSLFASLIFISCEKNENKVLYESGTAPVLTVMPITAQILNINNKDAQALTLSWTNPAYKFNTGISSQDVNYTLQFDKAGANFSSATMGQKSISKDLAYSMTVKDLNTVLLGMGLPENVAQDVEIRVKSTMANGSAPLYSNVVKVKVTPYLDVVYPVPEKLYITGSATPGNWQGNGDAELVSQKFTKVSSSQFQITIALSANNSYLFIPVYGSWNAKYGYKGNNNENNVNGDDFKPEGGDMKSPGAAGTYKITVDFKTGKWTVVKQ